MVKVLSSFVCGPLEPHITGFAEALLGQGYSRTSAAQHVCFLAHLDRWMSAERIGLEGLSEAVVERYLAARGAAGYRQYRSVKALRPLLDYLAPLGVLPVPPVLPPEPVEELLGRFGECLRWWEGLGRPQSSPCGIPAVGSGGSLVVSDGCDHAQVPSAVVTTSDEPLMAGAGDPGRRSS